MKLKVWVSIDDEPPCQLASRSITGRADSLIVGPSLLRAAAHLWETVVNMAQEVAEKAQAPSPPADDKPTPRRRVRPQPHSPLPPPLDNREAND